MVVGILGNKNNLHIYLPISTRKVQMTLTQVSIQQFKRSWSDRINNIDGAAGDQPEWEF